jgi:hypothetical protein
MSSPNLPDFDELWDFSHDGYFFEEIGECLLALSPAEKARPDFLKAQELLAKDV